MDKTGIEVRAIMAQRFEEHGRWNHSDGSFGGSRWIRGTMDSLLLTAAVMNARTLRLTNNDKSRQA